MSHALALICVFLVPAKADVPDLTGDVWSVCGDDGQYIWHDTRLTFTNQYPDTADDGDRLEGYSDWRSSGGHGGREYFGGIVTDDGTLVLQGRTLENEVDIVTSRYEARVSVDGTVIFDGVWLDGTPGIWAATRDGDAGAGTSLCSRAVPVS